MLLIMPSWWCSACLTISAMDPSNILGREAYKSCENNQSCYFSVGQQFDIYCFIFNYRKENW
jgi:hypothetical protein